MKPIGDYFSRFAKTEYSEYLASDPPAVLLIDAQTTNFKPIDGDPGDTYPRLQPDFDVGAAEAPSKYKPPRSVAYMVLPLVPGQDRDDPNHLLIGCAEHCDVRIEEASVSREHALIIRDGESYSIIDRGSTGGTCVDNDTLTIKARRPLPTGCKLTLGSLDLIFLDPTGFYHFVNQFRGD